MSSVLDKSLPSLRYKGCANARLFPLTTVSSDDKSRAKTMAPSGSSA